MAGIRGIERIGRNAEATIARTKQYRKYIEKTVIRPLEANPLKPVNGESAFFTGKGLLKTIINWTDDNKIEDYKRFSKNLFKPLVWFNDGRFIVSKGLDPDYPTRRITIHPDGTGEIFENIFNGKTHTMRSIYTDKKNKFLGMTMCTNKNDGHYESIGQDAKGNVLTHAINSAADFKK